MRYVDKSAKEPGELLEFRKSCKPNCTWDDFNTDGKNAVRDRLLRDQTYLCCYCMQRVDMGRMKVEHYLSREGHPEEQLIWSNLLASCLGGEGQPKTQQTCDTYKANNYLSISPLSNGHMEGIRYGVDGRVLHDSYQIDLDDTLNLNNKVLRYRRQSALEGLKQVLQTKLQFKKHWSKNSLEKKLSALRASPEGLPFLGLLEYWLERQIRIRA
ncbi:MAG: TIGR02646 family protein [Proteobacteria bacterium]|nr:TIGR02646 family protein [Pseudomonadota bacterium]